MVSYIKKENEVKRKNVKDEEKHDKNFPDM